MCDPNTDFISGYVHKMKERNSDRFIHLSERAGAPGSDEGLFFAGARYRFNDRLNIGDINYYSFDVMNTFYAETNANFDLAEEIPVHLAAQFTHPEYVELCFLGDAPHSIRKFSAQEPVDLEPAWWRRDTVNVPHKHDRRPVKP